jgi:hypothetical protein
MSLADDILSADQSQSLKVNVPEWKCDVWIRSLPLGDLQAWELDALRSNGQGIDDYRTRYLSKCLVDADGKPLFSNDQLKRLSGKVGARLYKLAQQHNEIDEKEIQELGKN